MDNSGSFIIEDQSGDTAVIQIGKALDFHTAGEFKTVTHELVEKGVINFVLDFSDTDDFDSTGQGSVFSLYRRVSPVKGVVVFASVTMAVQVVVQLTRIYKVFRQFPTVEAAMDAIDLMPVWMPVEDIISSKSGEAHA